ncbi:hypothetical protein L2E82_14752 [Cichorium intybus]|uniref:Uncharacterized protein n=1 Tax=Cichorium intybus TaxID=13427 RepID=A0ACB9F0B1_CICIN|nr:hypothetical protein L2E82_14752 [Cichorium intybus]
MATNENLPPNVIKQLAKELRNLNETPPEGIILLLRDSLSKPNISDGFVDNLAPGDNQNQKRKILPFVNDEICSIMLDVSFQTLLKKENFNHKNEHVALELWSDDVDGIGDFGQYRLTLVRGYQDMEVKYFGGLHVMICFKWSVEAKRTICGTAMRSIGKVGILTVSRVKLNEELLVNIDGKATRIGVSKVDEEWYSFHQFTDNISQESGGKVVSDENDEDDDEEDGISHTWMQFDDGLDEVMMDVAGMGYASRGISGSQAFRTSRGTPLTWELERTELDYHEMSNKPLKPHHVHSYTSIDLNKDTIGTQDFGRSSSPSVSCSTSSAQEVDITIESGRTLGFQIEGRHEVLEKIIQGEGELRLSQ